MNAKHRIVRLLDDPARQRLALVPTVEPIQLRTPGDILDLLEEQINAVRGDRWLNPLVKARTLGHLAAQVVKTLEATQLAARLEMLETVLKQRKDRELKKS
jgi:hypothetical protein